MSEARTLNTRQFHTNAGGFSVLAFQSGVILRSPAGVFASPSIDELSALRDALTAVVDWHQSQFPQVKQ